jgi:hypothetical protein
MPLSRERNALLTALYDGAIQKFIDSVTDVFGLQRHQTASNLVDKLLTWTVVEYRTKYDSA